MNQSNRVCKVEGHQEYYVYHICTLIDCDKQSRWCCSECIQKGIHLHNKQDNSHVLNKKELLSKLINAKEQYLNSLSNQYKTKSLYHLEQLREKCQTLIKLQTDYLKSIERYLNYITSDEDQARFEQYLGFLNDNNFQQLDDEKINQLLTINQFKQNENMKQSLSYPLDIIQQQLNQMECIIKEYQDNQTDNTNSIIDLRNKNYIIQDVGTTNDFYYGSTISKNAQYLAFGGTDMKLTIYDIQLKKEIQKYKLDYSIFICQFTEDSTQLYVGTGEGYIFGYNSKDNFKQIFKNQIHTANIYNIITIRNEYLITCSADRAIIKTDVICKKQMFKLTGHKKWVHAIDYNERDQIIVSSSGDNTIKFWNCSNYKNEHLLIDKLQAHNRNIVQIQFIYEYQYLLSLEEGGTLYKWKIDLFAKDLIKIQEFSDYNRIFNFYQVNQNQNLLLLCNNQIKIMDQKGATIKIIEHNGGQRSNPLECRQLDDAKYILIRTDKKILLAIAQE